MRSPGTKRDYRRQARKWKMTTVLRGGRKMENERCRVSGIAGQERVSVLVNGRQGALTLMFLASVSRLRVVIYLTWPIDRMSGNLQEGTKLVAGERIQTISNFI